MEAFSVADPDSHDAFLLQRGGSIAGNTSRAALSGDTYQKMHEFIMSTSVLSTRACGRFLSHDLFGVIAAWTSGGLFPFIHRSVFELLMWNPSLASHRFCFSDFHSFFFFSKSKLSWFELILLIFPSLFFNTHFLTSYELKVYRGRSRFILQTLNKKKKNCSSCNFQGVFQLTAR